MKPFLNLTWGLLSVVGLSMSAMAAEPTALPETPAQHDARMAWFREARFGLFIHWGVYSVPAGEWKENKGYGEWFLEETKMPVSQYEQFAKQFNPVKFDAKEWVQLAKNAGMKYVVITSKHHDGFGMYRSELTDWCIKSTPFQRDPLKELAEACKDAGITFCFYHSIMDWHHPDWGTRRAWNDRATGTPDMDRYTGYMKGQLKELLTNYGPIGILWFDGEWEAPWTHERGVDLYNYVRSLQPNIIINNRVGKARAGMSGMNQGNERIGDYGTPEQEIPATGFGPGVDWESCMTMNNHWGYNKNDQNWKSTAVLVRNLIDCASKGGNYLLNVGPTGEGLIPGPSVERLKEIGAWMSVNSESIYGTTASPFKRLSWGKCTQKPGKLYLHVFNAPAEGQILIPVRNKVSNARLLKAGSTTYSCTKTDDGWLVSLPPEADRNPIATVVAVDIEGAPDVISSSTLAVQGVDGSLTLPASEAICHGAQIRYEEGEKHDNVGYWVDPSDWVEWRFKATLPGTYLVKAKLASEGSGSFEVNLGDRTIKSKAPNTGNYAKYQEVELGTIEIKSTGESSLNVKAVRDNWAPFNIRSISLKPAK